MLTLRHSVMLSMLGWAPRLRMIEPAPVASTSSARRVCAGGRWDAASGALPLLCHARPAPRGGRKVRNQKRLRGQRLWREEQLRLGQNPNPRTHKGGDNYKGRGMAVDTDTQRRWGGWADRVAERLARLDTEGREARARAAAVQRAGGGRCEDGVKHAGTTGVNEVNDAMQALVQAAVLGDERSGDAAAFTLQEDALLALLRRLSRPPHGSSHRALAALRWAQTLATGEEEEEDAAAAGQTDTRRHAAPCERCYATVILLLGQRLDWRGARSLFDEMHTVSVPPGEYAYGALVSALGKGAQVGAALDAFREMQRLQLTVPPAVYHELIGACGAAGDGDGAEEVFAALQAHKGAPTRLSYDVLVTAQCAAGLWQEALHTLTQMRDDGVAPAASSYQPLLLLCERRVQWQLALQLLERMDEDGVRRELSALHAALATCVRARALDPALPLLREVLQMRGAGGASRDLAYTTVCANLVRACGDVGDTGTAFAVVSALDQAGVNVAAPVYAALLSACARAGKPARASAVLEDMWAEGVELTEACYAALREVRAATGWTAEEVAAMVRAAGFDSHTTTEARRRLMRVNSDATLSFVTAADAEPQRDDADETRETLPGLRAAPFDVTSVRELHAQCKRRGLSGYSQLRKAELVAWLQQRAPPASQASE